MNKTEKQRRKQLKADYVEMDTIHGKGRPAPTLYRTALYACLWLAGFYRREADIRQARQFVDFARANNRNARLYGSRIPS